MGFLDNLQAMLTKNKVKPNGERPVGATCHPPADLDNLLEPAALGKIITVMLSGGEVKSLFKIGGLSAVAALLWGKYKDFRQSFNCRDLALISLPSFPGGRTLSYSNKTEQLGLTGSDQSPEAAAHDLDGRMTRLIKAMIFAARNGNQINAQEYQAIDDQLQQFKVGPQARKTIQEAMEQPIEPALVAEGLVSSQEAVELYLISCSVLDVDELETNAYLAAMAKALNITDSLKKELEGEVSQKVRDTIRRF